MTIINLSGLEAALGLPGPLALGEIRASRWAGRGPAVQVTGAEVTFPHEVVIRIAHGASSTVLDLPPTTQEWCYRVTVADRSTGRSITRYVAVPAVGPVDFGDLQQVDPTTFQPLPAEVSDAWDAALGQAQGAAMAAAGSADDAAEAALAADFSVQQAAGHATTAQQAATQAGASAFNAGSSAAAAQSSEDDARAAATAAAGSASAAAGSASAASGSATDAATSAGSAASAVTAAQAARTGAETARTGAETARTGAEAAQAGMVTGGTIDGAGHLILSKLGGGTIDAGNATGPAGADSTIPGPPGNPTAYEMRGTGFPEGAVTASPGTYYTDTAGTNGAWRWIKVSGTGNTGWRVVHGDTGWREIAPVILDPAIFDTALSTFMVRRVSGSPGVVLVRSIIVPKVAGGGWTTTDMPTGFRPIAIDVSNLTWSWRDGFDDGKSYANSVAYNYKLRFQGFPNTATAASAAYRVTGGVASYGLSELDSKTWPSVLPGTPAAPAS